MNMTLSNKILSDIAVHSKYARYVPELLRREVYEEIVKRVEDMHIEQYPHMASAIKIAMKSVYERHCLPSMRSMQFAGLPIFRNPARIYNCAFAPVDHPDIFSETMFLLLGGTGLGYSVQKRHVNKLPKVQKRSTDSRRYVVGDSIEGWADSVKVLVESFFYGKERINFDFGDIREKGTELVTSGGKAPGPGPLRIALAKIEGVLEAAVGRKLTPLECHDIQCHIADAVLAGGIRRAAMICLFDKDDQEMLFCKSGEWWVKNPQRGRANNSIAMLRGSVTYEEFKKLWKAIKESGAGEPAFYWTNDLDWGTNPLPN
jgi:ribonucleoside-diphosphate reductase alpha chain